MALPEELQAFIENEARKYPADRLQAASDDLTRRYRERDVGKQAFMTSDIHRIAYLVARMPATYAVVKHVLSQIPFSITSLLDLGSGPGTVLWAASEIFSELSQATCVEQDTAMLSLAKQMAPKGPTTRWQANDIANYNMEFYDAVILSYAIGELSDSKRQQLIAKAWSAAKKCVVIIEPGTMAGFAGIRSSRAELISFGACIAAPCPHNNACPMPADDWCHFAERLDRTSLHRRLKSGSLSYEDEKYSYIIASKIACDQVPARILRHPVKHPGLVNLELCTPEGLQKQTISKRDKELYKEARKAEWGDAFGIY